MHHLLAITLTEYFDNLLQGYAFIYFFFFTEYSCIAKLQKTTQNTCISLYIITSS